VVEGAVAGISQLFTGELMDAQERFAASTKFAEVIDGELVLVQKSYENVVDILSDTSVAALDVLTSTFAIAIVEGENAASAVARTFLDMLQSLVPAFAAMIFGVSSASPANIASLGIWGAVKFAATMGVLTGLIQSAKSAIGGAWTGALPGVKSPEAQKNPNDTTMIWWNPREAIVPANITEREMPLLKALFAGKTSEQFFNENYQPRFNIATPSVNVSGGGDAKTQRLLEQIVSNTSRKTSGRMAIEHEFAPLKLSSDGLVAEYKRSLARELRRV
jgi:hypothetical protein